MAKLTYILGLLLVLSSCDFNSSYPEDWLDNPTTVEFEEQEYDFGNITEGDKVTHTFKFKNTGDTPLRIFECISNCGCTTSEDCSKKEPIAPGEWGEVTVEFSSAFRPGPVVKSLTINMNTRPVSNVVKLKGAVLKQK